MKQIFSIIALGVILITSQASAQNTTETIVTTGMGSSIESAIQSAARNALTQAVGQFVDTETQISKRTEIRDGVREITKDLSEDISATSNGTIQEVQVLDQQGSDGIFQVEAAVTVRISDLERAMEGRLQVEAGVSNVFAQVARANEQNINDKAKILRERFIDPLLSTDYLNVSVGEPQTLQNYINSNDVDKLEGGSGGYMSLLQGKYSTVVDGLVDLYSSEGYTLLVVPVDISFSQSALNEWKSTLTELASHKSKFAWKDNAVDRGTRLFEKQGNFKSWEAQIRNLGTERDLPICFAALGNGAECFLISGMGTAALEKSFNPYFADWVLKHKYGSFKGTPIRSHPMSISVVDANEFPVVTGELVKTSGRLGGLIGHLNNMYFSNNKPFGFERNLPSQVFPMTPHSASILGNVTSSGGGLPPIINIIESRRIHVGLILKSDQLAKAASIKADIQDGFVAEEDLDIR